MKNPDLITLLQCPVTREPFETEMGNKITSQYSKREYDVIDGSPNFLDYPLSSREFRNSHALPGMAQDLISNSEGLVLNLGAGGTQTKLPNVVELDYGLFQHTDVASDAHSLPFKENTFSGVVCCNSFEHFRDPALVVAELDRVLKASSFVYVLTAFLQPFHMEPHHYFNATVSGVREWFKQFDIQHCETPSTHNGLLALMWISKTVLWSLEQHDINKNIKSITLGELADAWDGEPPEAVKNAFAALANMPSQVRNLSGQAVELVAVSKKGFV